MNTPAPRFNLFRRSEFETVPAGTIIFSAGDAGNCMFAVRAGEVELLVGDHVVEVVPEDGIFGEMAIIDREPRTATARARTACELVRIDEPRFNFLVQETPLFALHVLRLLAHRLRRANDLTLS